MKVFIMVPVLMFLTACGTMGGALSGAGDDLQKVGNWVKSR